MWVGFWGGGGVGVGGRLGGSVPQPTHMECLTDRSGNVAAVPTQRLFIKERVGQILDFHFYCYAAKELYDAYSFSFS